MFKFVFDLATEPLGLPVEWYYEWIILLVIGEIAYQIAYDKVGTLYHGDFISGALPVKSDNVPSFVRRYVFVGKEVRL